jgi:PAS domain S-box-containing protein
MPVVITHARDDSVLRVNEEYTAAFGLSGAEVAGKPFRDLHWAPEDRDRTLAAHSAGAIESVEVRMRSASGECRWAQADVAAFEYDGEPVYLNTLYDIGQLKGAQRKLEESRAVLGEMARFPEMNPGPVARLEIDGTILRANAPARAVLGTESLEGACLWDLLPGLDVGLKERIVEAGAPTCEEVKVGDVWLALTFAYEEASRHIFVYGTDVTAQKRAEGELAERARFPQLNPGPVARLRADGTVIRANPAAGRVFGKDSIAGASFRALAGIDDDTWSRILTTGEMVRHEETVDDRWISFTLVYEPLLDQVFAYGSDITELKKAQHELAELARFPEMNPGPVLRLDKEGKVLLANRAARRLFDLDELAGRSWLDLCPGVDAAFWSSVRRASEPVPLEAKLDSRFYMLHHAPGPEGAFVFVYGSDLTAQKTAESALRQSERMATLGTLTAGMAHELNNPAAAAQRAAEQLEIAFADLERAHLTLRGLSLGTEVDRLLAELGEQARQVAANPIEIGSMERVDRETHVERWLEDHGVEHAWESAPGLVEIGYTPTTLDELVGKGAGDHVGLVVAWQAQAHRVYRLAGEIRHGSSRLVEIVSAMKAYAYLGQAPLQTVDVNEGLRNTLVILRSKLGEGIEVVQALDPDLPPVEAYGSELNQVWTHLIDNAADALDGAGHIAIKTRLADDRLIVEVEDDGPGIPLSAQPQVFDAFFTTKPPGMGTGLGLNTCYNIVVKKHAGSIEVSSVPGRTCFTVSLPLRVAPAREEEPGAQVDDPGLERASD